MLLVPRIGQAVTLVYNRRLAASGGFPYAGHAGVVVARKTKGRPRSHLIRLDCGRLVIVPCGHLRGLNLVS